MPVPKPPSSIFEEDSDREDRKGLEAPLSESGDEETASEAFETPMEQGPQYGAFGEELRDDEDDPKRKKAADAESEPADAGKRRRADMMARGRRQRRRHNRNAGSMVMSDDM